MPPRFLLVADVAEILQISGRQVLGLLNSGELRGIRVNARGHWRIEASEVEAFIRRRYERTQAEIEGRVVDSDAHGPAL